VDADSGEVVGSHRGAYAYTVGQRKGLNLTRPAPDGNPRYVLAITPVNNTVTVGPAAALDVSLVTGDRPVWTVGAPPTEPVQCEVQLRAHAEPVSAVVSVEDGCLRARLAQPVRGVAAGQAMVAYRPDTAGDIVLGSATVR
jgi:tRNA-specific 2-thiouridylase